MSRIDVSCKIKVYAIDGDDSKLISTKESPIEVLSHGTRDWMAILSIEGKQYTVVGSDLIQAVQNAMNSN